MPLTKGDLDKVRAKNIANLIKLANSGKPLTRAQQAEIEAFAAGGNEVAGTGYVRRQSDLAAKFGITRQTIADCLRKFKRATPPVPTTMADGRYDVAAWGAFLRAHNIARIADEPNIQERTTVTEWKQEKLRLECERITLDIAQRKTTLVEVADLEATLGSMLSAFRTAANNVPGRAAQKLIGLKDFHEIEEILQGEIATMLRTLEACPFAK